MSGEMLLRRFSESILGLLAFAISLLATPSAEGQLRPANGAVGAPEYHNEVALHPPPEQAFELFPEPPENRLPGELPPPAFSKGKGGPPANLRELMRPVWSFGAEWQSKTMGVSLATYDAAIRFPTYPFFGPPPPFWSVGLELTDIHAPVALDLPTTLYDASVGGAWVRPVNEFWTVRVFATLAYTSDGDASSSEAWRVRGGGFAIYKPNDAWQFLFGAIALGRNDLPVVPAIGAIWSPHERLRVDLTLPRPRVNWAFLQTADRQHWLHFGAGFNGGTWAYETQAGVDDVITFRDWRIVLGWESTPIKPPGAFVVRGTVIGADIAYVFSREFEFDSGRPDLALDDAVLFRTQIRF